MRLRSRAARGPQAQLRRIYFGLVGGLFFHAGLVRAAEATSVPAPATQPDAVPPLTVPMTPEPSGPPALPTLILAPTTPVEPPPVIIVPPDTAAPPGPPLELPVFTPPPDSPPPGLLFELPPLSPPPGPMLAPIPLITFPANFNFLTPPMTTPPAASRPKLSIYENEFYEVVAPDFESADTVLGLTKRLQIILASHFPWPETPQRRIEVQLVPAAQADFAGAFLVIAEDDGGRVARIRWNADTKFSDVCLALSLATLERLATWQGGPAMGASVPDWMKIAFAKELETSVKPALKDLLAEQARALPALTLRQIMGAQGPYDDDALAALTVNAYWLAAFLYDETNHGDDTRALFNSLLAGIDPPVALRQAFPDRFASPAELESWWDVGYLDISTRRGALVQSMARTHAALDHFQEILVPAKGNDEYLRLDEAWAAPARATGEMRRRIAAQLQQANSEYPPPYLSVNPVFSNAFKSLLIALDKLYGDDEKAFRAAWLRYQTDRADALQIEQTVNAAMATP